MSIPSPTSLSLNITKMRLNSIIILSLFGLATASPVPAESSSDLDAEFKFDQDRLEIDYKLALEKAETDPHLLKRLNTESANNVAYGKAIDAAGEAIIKQVRAISNWNRVRVYASIYLDRAIN